MTGKLSRTDKHVKIRTHKPLREEWAAEDVYSSYWEQAAGEQEIFSLLAMIFVTNLKITSQVYTRYRTHQHLVKPPSPSERRPRFVKALLSFRLIKHENLAWTLPYGERSKKRLNSVHHKSNQTFQERKKNMQTRELTPMPLIVLLRVRSSARRWSVWLGAFGLHFLGRFFAVLLSWLLLLFFQGRLSPVEMLKHRWARNIPRSTCTYRFRSIYESLTC